MSNDLRRLLREAATVPATEADVAGAWRRGRRMRMQRRAVSGLAIVAIVALGSVAVANVVPSGGHNTTPIAPGPTASTAPQPRTKTTVTTAPQGTSTTVPTNVGPKTCPTKFLTALLGPPNGTAGHMNYEISFRNDSTSACVMSGYPGVSFLDGSGRQIGVPAERNPMPHNPVTLAPGATAYAHLAVTDPSVLAGCPAVPVHQIRIFPPNETVPVNIGAGSITVCSAQTPSSSIDPVVDHPTY